MKRFAPTIAVLLLAALVYAVTPVKISSPALTGMNSNYDVDELKKTDARLLVNSNISEHLGRVQKRRGLAIVGGNTELTYAPFGYVNTDNGYVQLLGVTRKLASVIGHVDSTLVDATYEPDTTLFPLGVVDSSLRDLSYSDSGGSSLQGSSLTKPLLSVGGDSTFNNYGFESFENGLVFYNKHDISLLYQPQKATIGTDAHQQDSLKYSPHFISLGLEAPGQLRVGVVSGKSSSYKSGTYRYMYGYTLASGVVSPSIASRWITVDSQRIFVDLFEDHPNHSVDSFPDYYKIAIYRQKYQQEWRLIVLRVALTGGEGIVFIDSVADGVGSGLSDIDNNGDYKVTENTLDVSNATPGAFFRHTSNLYNDTVTGLVNGTDMVPPDSAVFIAYSYYDPVSGMESPLGRKKRSVVVTDPGTDTLFLGFAISDTRTNERPNWIRVYRTSGQDSTVWYSFGQFRVGELAPDSLGTVRSDFLFLGVGADSQLTGGMVRYLLSDTTQYRQNDIILNENGDGIIRPPYVEQLEIPFTDVNYANARLWGVGDPLFPSRLYYSGFDNVGSWLATNFLSVGENSSDVLVCMESSPVNVNDDVLYAFKHNSIYAITGYDVEYDLQLKLLTRESGAVNRNSVVQVNDEIFYLSPNLKIYSLRGSKATPISNQIENWVDSLYGSYDNARSKAYAFVFRDEAIWVNRDSTFGLVFNSKSRTWKLNEYTATMNPVGSFQYDTSQNITGFGDEDWWFWRDTTAGAFLTEHIGYFDSSSVINTVYPFVYQTPFVGDGEWMYRIQEIGFTGTWSGTMTLNVLNSEGDTLATTTATAVTDSIQTYRVGLPIHESDYLSVEFSASTASSGEAWIGSVNLYPVRMRKNVTK